jgi:DNA-binding transcriptional regulator YdaS (Cro superfamily)
MHTRRQSIAPFRAWLGNLIDEALISRKEFASRIGVHETTIQDWMSGRSRPCGANIVRIARALNVSREEVEAHLPGELLRAS